MSDEISYNDLKLAHEIQTAFIELVFEMSEKADEPLAVIVTASAGVSSDMVAFLGSTWGIEVANKAARIVRKDLLVVLADLKKERGRK